MPRYYFHLKNDLDVRDDEGEELSSLEEARTFALAEARSLVAASVKEEGRIVLHHRIDIEDEQHRVIDTVLFGDAVQVLP